MKKTISIILLFLVYLSYTVAAYAEGENNSWDESDASEGPCFTVIYDGPIGMTAPEETLHFTVSEVNGHSNPDHEMITIPDIAINNKQTTVPIVLPEFKSVGEYQYCITQDAGSYPEFEYDTGQIIFHVLVGYDVSDNIQILATGIGFSDSGKKVSFTNRFGYGTLNISSNVIGTDQDRDKDFEVTILFTVPEGREVLSPISYTVLSSNGTKTVEGSIPANWDGRVKEVTLTLKHGSTATFSNIPAGVLYSVTQETEAGFDVPEISPTSGTITAGISENTSVTNRAVFNLGTGILFQNTGHIIILVIGIIGLTVLLLRGIRRRG